MTSSKTSAAFFGEASDGSATGDGRSGHVPDGAPVIASSLTKRGRNRDVRTEANQLAHLLDDSRRVPQTVAAYVEGHPHARLLLRHAAAWADGLGGRPLPVGWRQRFPRLAGLVGNREGEGGNARGYIFEIFALSQRFPLLLPRPVGGHPRTIGTGHSDHIYM